LDTLAASKTKFWFFENFDIFKALAKADRVKLANKAYEWRAAKGKLVFQPGQAANIIFILKSGRVKISKRAGDGREIILYILQPGEIFGELALAGEEKRDSFAVTLEPADICGVPLDHFQDVLRENPSFNLQITKMIGQRLSKIQSRLTSLCFLNASDRIRSFIRDLAKDYGRKVGEEVEIKMLLKHDEIAKLTATSRQTVTAVLSELEKQNLILYDRRRILIRDCDAL
jgi:CRP/FNR family cyclic AMP-dependent transcriptional regulator